MLSEYITSLADVSFHIVAYMYARFRYSGKIRCGLRFFGVFLCGFAVFGPPLRPPLDFLTWGDVIASVQSGTETVSSRQR